MVLAGIITLHAWLGINYCGSWSEMSLLSHRHLDTCSPVGGCLGSMRRYGLYGRRMSLRVSFKISCTVSGVFCFLIVL